MTLIKKSNLDKLENKLKFTCHYLLVSYFKASKSKKRYFETEIVSPSQLKELLVVNLKYYFSIYRQLHPAIQFNTGIATIFNDSISFVLEDFDQFVNKEWVNNKLHSNMNLAFPVHLRETQDAFFIFTPSLVNQMSVDCLVLDRFNQLHKQDIRNIKRMCNQNWPLLYKEVCIHYTLDGIQ